MRKLTALLFAVALVLGVATLANAQKTYTWQLVESTDALELWPNEADSPNLFEANGGLLGRVNSQDVLDTAEDTFTKTYVGACEMAPSFKCQAGSPPGFLLPAGSAEPATPPIDSECNRQTISCNSLPVDLPFAVHGGHVASPPGEYSYMIIHTPGVGTEEGGKGVSFFSGSYSASVAPYVCNDCPPIGQGKDQADQYALDNTGPGAVTQTTDVSMWATQSSEPFGHFSLALISSGPGKQSPCGSGIQFNNLAVDLCIDGTQANGNFQLIDQKLFIRTYLVDSTTWANKNQPNVCNPPDCYVENVIIPAAVAQAGGGDCGSGGACAVQTQVATTILPPTAPEALIDATVDTLLFAMTTQQLDADGDGQQDGVDPCPNDPTDFCKNNLAGGGLCPTGEVFCLDQGGAAASCKAGALCETRLDVDQSCDLRIADAAAVVNSVAFNSINIGPFDP